MILTLSPPSPLPLPKHTTAFQTITIPKLSSPSTHLPYLQHRPVNTPKPILSPRQNPTKSPKPIKHNRKPIKTVVTTTSSDVLHLMNILNLPVPLDIYESLIKECSEKRDVIRGVELHKHIKESIRRPGVVLNNCLLEMYLACGRMDLGRELFDNLFVKDETSSCCMITAYVDEGEYVLALEVFRKMLENGVGVSSAVVACVLKACIAVNEFGFGMQIHGLVLKSGGSSKVYIGSLFIDFYGKFKCLERARMVFNHLEYRDTVVWTAMIVLYIRAEDFEEGLELYKRMVEEGVKRNNFTFSGVIKACARIGDDGNCGREVHADALKLGIDSDMFVQCSLVDMYGKCGRLKDARTVFELIYDDKRNVVCWNAMLCCYIRYGSYKEAMQFLYVMKGAGIQPLQSMLDEVKIACGY